MPVSPTANLAADSPHRQVDHLHSTLGLIDVRELLVRHDDVRRCHPLLGTGLERCGSVI